MTNDSPDNLSPYAIDRSALLAALTACLADNQDNQQLTLLALVDLKHFGQINQRYGYLVGDHILAELQQRLAAIPKHPIACRRIDGDKFALIISPLLHIQLVPLVAKKIIDQMTCYFSIDNQVDNGDTSVDQSNKNAMYYVDYQSTLPIKNL